MSSTGIGQIGLIDNDTVELSNLQRQYIHGTSRLGKYKTESAKYFINDIFKNEIYRSYGEKSKAALGKVMKTYPWDILKDYTRTPAEADKILNGKYKLTPIKSVPQAELPGDAQMTLTRYPELLDYGYLRDINGTPTFKVLIGTPGQNIIG